MPGKILALIKTSKEEIYGNGGHPSKKEDSARKKPSTKKWLVLGHR